MDQWKLINDVRRIDQSSFAAEASAPEGSVWFVGHFPGEPILPGIAMVQAVYTAVKEDARARGEDVELTSLRRIRFTSPVRPGEPMDIHVSRDVSGSERVYTFRVGVKDNVVCTGVIAAGQGRRDKKAEKEDGNA